MTTASEKTLNKLHVAVARVFEKVLTAYEKRLDVIDGIVVEELTEEAIKLLMDADVMPNPAMMAAITKFLKDNQIAFDIEEIAALSATEERLAARKAKRGNLISLTSLAVAGNG